MPFNKETVGVSPIDDTYQLSSLQRSRSLGSVSVSDSVSILFQSQTQSRFSLSLRLSLGSVSVSDSVSVQSQSQTQSRFCFSLRLSLGSVSVSDSVSVLFQSNLSEPSPRAVIFQIVKLRRGFSQLSFVYVLFAFNIFLITYFCVV